MEREKSGMSRLYGGGAQARKVSSKGDATPRSLESQGEPAEKGKEDGDDRPGVLRKRSSSIGDHAKGAGALKPGQSILEQIGTPDHSGWMRKKGDRYNTWRNRYFVLKGSHLYCLKSNSKSVSLWHSVLNRWMGS